jgi:hypothetical protein
MNKRITITKANFLDSKLYLHASESISGLSPAEQILVDSKEFSFVYLLENLEGYTNQFPCGFFLRMNNWN